MLADVRRDRSGFLSASLIRLADHQWLDVVRWASDEDYDASRVKGANLPGIAGFFALVDEVVSFERGVTQELSPDENT